MAGLIGVGRNTLGQASVGFQQSAGLEANRNAAQQQLDAARSAQRSSMVATGAGLGGSIGVNNYMANAATQKGIESFGQRIGIDGISKLAAQETATTVAPEVVATVAPEVVATAAPEVLTTAAIDAATAAGTTAAGTTAAGATAAGTTAATTAGTGAVVGGASTGAMATIGAIATPLLIGAGAALLLDSVFDIF